MRTSAAAVVRTGGSQVHREVWLDLLRPRHLSRLVLAELRGVTSGLSRRAPHRRPREAPPPTVASWCLRMSEGDSDPWAGRGIRALVPSCRCTSMTSGPPKRVTCTARMPVGPWPHGHGLTGMSPEPCGCRLRVVSRPGPGPSSSCLHGRSARSQRRGRLRWRSRAPATRGTARRQRASNDRSFTCRPRGRPARASRPGSRSRRARARRRRATRCRRRR